MLLVEWLAAPGGQFVESFTAWDTSTMDTTMLSVWGASGSRVRTAAEFRAVLAAGGFNLKNIIPTKGSVSILEGWTEDASL